MNAGTEGYRSAGDTESLPGRKEAVSAVVPVVEREAGSTLTLAVVDVTDAACIS